jgi:FkbM family methyltransferase
MINHLNSKGIIHVGANMAQEADSYESMGARVIWIEAIPREKLTNKVDGYQHQSLIYELVTDKDEEQYVFHISSNNGESSSILKFKEHKKLWPKVHYNNKTSLRSKKLDTIIKENKINVEEYTSLTLDTQGSELLILKGADEYLKTCEEIIVEAPNFESYENCPQVDDFDKFLSIRGFKQIEKKCFKKKGQKEYYDILYKKQNHICKGH